jgi:T5SS/PEP-CTERM-associated repeat protein
MKAKRVAHAAALFFACFATPTFAGDAFWTNAIAGDFVNGVNWLSHSVPGPPDNAHFNLAALPVVSWSSSRTNANAFINAPGGGLQAAVGSSHWRLTNSFVVGGNPGSTGVVLHLTGQIRVTNASGTGLLVVGSNGRGTYALNGSAANLVADRLFATNNGAGFTNSTFLLNAGTFTTLRGSVIVPSGAMVIGGTADAVATWNILGGTNICIASGTTLGSVSDSIGSVWVSGPATVWSNSASLTIGAFSSSCRLVVSNGAGLRNTSATIGSNHTNNQAWITGSSSVWTNNGNLTLGQFGSRNLLVVSNGGAVFNQAAFIGSSASAVSNLAVVTGSGSLWRAGSLNVGHDGPRNTVVVTNAGTIVASFVNVGANAGATNNLLAVGGGLVFSTNAGGSARLEVQRGTLRLDDGWIQVDVLRATNQLGTIAFNGGTLNVRTTTVSNQQTFFVGDGSSPAVMNLLGNGAHSFANALIVRSQGMLTGNGIVNGSVSLHSGGTLSPGASIGKLILSNAFAPKGILRMEISKNGAALTNDHVQVAEQFAFGGTLIVTNIGPTPLSAGDQFPIFNATNFSGVFFALTLPPLGGGLMWTNKLLVNGSIAVVPFAPPRFSQIGVVGTNVLFTVAGGPPGAAYDLLTTTNLAQPIITWATNRSGTLDWLGTLTFTNGVPLGEPRRFFALQLASP